MANALADFVSHSHTVRTSQPRARSSASFLASRSTFRLNLSCQNSILVFGVLAILQPVCRCQKQPCTKITLCNRGSVKSGVPGKSRRCSRKRYPSAWMSRRTIISGLVSRGPIRAIRAERSGETLARRCGPALWSEIAILLHIGGKGRNYFSHVGRHSLCQVA